MNLLVVTSRGASRRKLQEFDRRTDHGGWVSTQIPLSEFAAVDLNNFDDLAIAGGDGTINACLRRANELPILVVPAGTGNDFARSLRIETVGDSARALRAGQRRKIDLGGANGEPFINGIGIGLDGVVAKKHERGIGYAAATLGSVMRLPRFGAKISIDNEPAREIEFLSIAIANGEWSGGGFRTAPGSAIDDGLLNLVMISPVSRMTFLRALAKAKKGRHIDNENVTTRKCRSILLESETPMPWHLDGECRMSQRIEVTINPRAKQFYRL